MTFNLLNGRLVLLIIVVIASTTLVVTSFVPDTKCFRRGKSKKCIAPTTFVLSVANGGSSLPNVDELETVNVQQISNTSSMLIVEDQENNQSTTNATAPTTTISKFGPKATPPGMIRKTFPSVPWHQVPNWLTIVRCIALPIFGAVFYLPRRHLETSIIFSVASLTDFLDGYLARRWDVSTSFGAFLDPVADKLMVSTALILLAGRFGPSVAIPTSIILAREIGVSALREWMAQRGLRDIVKVGFQGKAKTALTMISLSLMLLVNEGTIGSSASKISLLAVSKICLYLCTVLTVTSGSVYLRAALPYLLE